MRPMINTYEVESGVEQLVHREMTEDEHKQWLADQEAAQAWADELENAPHPVLAAVASMSDEERAELRKLLGA